MTLYMWYVDRDYNLSLFSRVVMLDLSIIVILYVIGESR